MHLYCLSLGKQLSPEETSYAPVCINKPTHQAYFTRQNSPPKHRWGDQTVGFPTRRPKRLCFIVVESQNIFTAVLQPSSIWWVFHGLHSYKKWFWVRVTVFSPATYKVPGTHLENGWKWRIKFIPRRECWRRLIRNQVDLKLFGAHHPPEQTP